MKKRVKGTTKRILAFQTAAVILITAAFVVVPRQQVQAAEEKIRMDENAYDAMGFDTNAEDAEESFLGPGNTVLCPQNELYFDFNGSSNYGYVMRDNLNLYQTIENNLKQAGAYERYGQYRNGDWANLEDKYGYTKGSLGGQELSKSLTSKNTHKSRAYAVSTAFKSASGKDDRIAQLYVKSGRKRSEYTVCLEILAFTKSCEPSCVSMVELGSPAGLDQTGNWYNEQFDALFEITAGDYDGDGVDEVAVYAADNAVKIYKTANDKLTLWQTISSSEIQAETGKTITSDSGVDANNEKQMAAVVSLASGDLMKDYTEDLAIAVSMPNLMDTKKNNRAFIYGFSAGGRKMVKNHTIDLNEIADGSNKYPMLAVNAAIGDMTGNGRQELVIAGRVGGEKIGAIHVEYNFEMHSWEASEAQLLSDSLDTNLLNRTLAGPGYHAPVGLSVCNFGKASDSLQRIFIFDGLYSYGDSMFTKQDQKLYYSMGQRKNDNKTTDKDAVWISKVLSGNFTGDKGGSQQIAALMGVKEKGQDKYWYEVCFISYQNNQWYRSWEGIINQATSYLNNSEKSRASAYVALSMPDVDEDSMLLKYLGAETFYTKPEVQAVLQSAPYFQDVADTYDSYLNEGATAYGISKGSGNSVTAGLDLSLGVYTSAEVSLFAEGEIEAGLSTATSYEHQESWETSVSVEYAVGQGDDYVVMYTIPYHRYWYEYEDPKDHKKQMMSIEEPLTPSTVVVPVDTYDEMAETYQGLEPVRGNLLNSVPGEPLTYTKTFQADGSTPIGEVQRLSNSGNNSSSNVTVSREANVTKEDSISVSVDEELKVGGGAGIFGTGVKAGVTQSFSIAAGYVHSKMNGVTYSGTVDNLPAGVSGYGFNWQFGAREAELNGDKAVVIGFQTSNVQEPPKVPRNLTIVEIGSRDMVLEWDASAGAAVYELMLITSNGMELPQASIPCTEEDENGNIRYRVSNLTPNTQYSYSVTAVNASGARSLSGSRVSGITTSEDQAGFKIIMQPKDAEAAVGKTAQFSVDVENQTGSSLNYRWQRYDETAREWKYCTGEYDRTMTVTGTRDLDGAKYRCVIYTGGTMLISSTAVLTIGKSQSEVSLSVKDPSGNRLEDYDVVQASGMREVRKKTGEQKVPYVVTAVKDGVTYTKTENSAGVVLWVSSDENSDSYYEDQDGAPADEKCTITDRIIFVSQDTENPKTYTAEASSVTLPSDAARPSGITASEGYRITDAGGGYIFAAVSGDESGGYYDQEGTELLLDDTLKTAELSGGDVVNVYEFQEVEELRTEDVYESKTELEQGDEISFTAAVKDAGSKTDIADAKPCFQITDTATGISVTKEAVKNSSGAYTASYTFGQAGIYTVTAVYTGSGQYSMSRSQSITLIVKSAETGKQLFISGGSMTYGETLDLSPRLIDSAGASQPDTGVVYTVKRDNIAIDASAAGILGNQFTPKMAGTYQITAVDSANQAETVSSVQVSKRTLILTPPDLEGVIADSRAVREQKLTNAVTHANTNQEGKVRIQGLAGSDTITGYSLSCDAVTANYVGEYAVQVVLDENSANIKALSENYTFVLNRGVYSLGRNRVQVNAAAGSNGTIRIRYQLNGQTVEVGSGTYIPMGVKLTVTADPSAGFGIEKWVVDGQDLENTEETFTVDSLMRDITIQVVFSHRYSVLNYAAVNNGSVRGVYEGEGQMEFASGGRVNQNQSVILTAEPDKGYVVDHWGVRKNSQEEETLKAEDGTSVYTGDTYTLSNVREDTSVRVFFKKKEEKTVTLCFKNRADNTKVSALGTTLLINGESVESEDAEYRYRSFSGDNLTLDIRIPDNMLIDHWAAVNGSGTETTVAGDVRQLKLYNLSQDCSYVVYCSIPNSSLITYGSVLDTAGGNGGTPEDAGTITVEGASSPVLMPQGTEIVFNAASGDGYDIRKWTVDGKEAVDNITVNKDGSQTYRMIVKSNSTVQVHFEKKPVILAAINTSGGTVEISADDKKITAGSAVEFGSRVKWTIKPEKGYVIDLAALNGEDITKELTSDSGSENIWSCTAENVQSNQRLRVTFRKLETCTIRYAAADVDGDGTGDYGIIGAAAERLGIAAYQETKTAALTGEITVYEGGEAIFTPEPENTAYDLKECIADGRIRTPEEDGTIRLVWEDLKKSGSAVDLTMKFGLAHFSVLEYGAEEHGSVEGVYAGSGQIAFASGGQLNESQTVILTASAQDGYTVDHWTVQRGSQGIAETVKAEDLTSDYTGSRYTVSDVREDTVVRVFFKVKEEKTVTLQFKNRADDTDVFTLGTTLMINGESVQEANRMYTYEGFSGDNLTLDITVPDNMLVDHWAAVNSDGTETEAAGSVRQMKIYNLSQDCRYVVYCSIPNASEITYGTAIDNTHGNGGTTEAAGEITAEGITASPVSKPQGTEITFTARANRGYTIRKWTVNGTQTAENITVNEDGSQTYQMIVKADTDVRVHFEKNPVVAVTADMLLGDVVTAADGRVTAARSAVAFGSNIEWTVTPVKGYVIEQVTLNGEDITQELSVDEGQKDVRRYSVDDVNTDQNLNVTFRELETYTIRYSVVDLNNDGVGDYGTVGAVSERLDISAYQETKEAALTGEITIYEGGRAIFTQIPDQEQYRVTECLVNGENYDLQQDGTILITAEWLAELASPVEMTVKFESSAPTITFTNPTFLGEEKGTIRAFAAGAEIYSGALVNSPVTFTVTPEENYEVKQWTINGDEVAGASGNEFVYSNSGRVNSRVTAVLCGERRNVSAVSENMSEGTVEALPAEIRYGDHIILKAEASPGFLFAGWYLKGEKVSDAAEYAFTVEEDASYEAKFEVKQQKEVYAVTLVPAENGTVRAAVNGTDVTEVEEGMEVTFQAEPKTYWYFSKWMINGEEAPYGAEFTLTAGKDFHEDLVVEAVFAQAVNYDVCFGADGGGTIEGSADNEIMTPDVVMHKVGGSVLKFRAVPGDGNMTAEWKINGEPVEGNVSNELVIESLSHNVDVRVSFKPYRGYKIPADTDHYNVKDIERLPADTPEAGEIRENGTLSFTISPAEEDQAFRKLEICGIDCLNTPSGERVEVQNGDQISAITVTENQDHSYTVVIENIRTDIRSEITAETVVLLEKAKVEVPDQETLIYNGREQIPKQVTVTVGNTVLEEDDYDISYSNNKNAGTAKITVSGKGAYAGTAEGTYQILPRPLTITADNVSRNYACEDVPLTYQMDGLVPGDTVRVALKRQSGENPGRYKILVEAQAGENYQLAYRSGIFTIVDTPLPEKMVNGLNNGLKMKWKNQALTVAWGKVSVADGYDVFVAPCNKKFSKKASCTVTDPKKNQVKLKKVAGKKLMKTQSYKAIIRPFRMENGTKTYIASSYSLHCAGKANKMLTNAKKIRVKKKYTLKQGKTARIAVKITKEMKAKQLMMHSFTAGKGVCFWSEDKNIAAVTKKGKIKAVSRGSCKIYVMAENGVKSAVKVTVK